MFVTLKVSPLTRVEGHLDIEVTVGKVNGVQQVVSAKSSGTMFRGFEEILKNRDPQDAVHLTQRVCGVCPISHGMAAALTLDAAYGVGSNLPANGRILRNIVLGANFIQSHILHFYHLAAPDFIDTTGALDLSPFVPRFVTPDMVTGGTAGGLIEHYVQALAMRRKAHQLGAVFGGKLPCSPTFVGGGFTDSVTGPKITECQRLLGELRDFINGVYIPDVQAVGQAFPEYAEIGRGCGNLLAYGVFDLDALGNSKLLARGRYTNGQLATVDVNQIREYVKYSKYTSACGNLNPASGLTVPEVHKQGAYSWVKAPRYASAVHEVGPLARMYVNGDYRTGISVLDRHVARALECKKVADAMVTWLGQLTAGGSTYYFRDIPTTASGIGLTEAPRGALGHWITIGSKKITRYQIVTPTAWNASPRDDSGKQGAIEQALVGTPVQDLRQPVEVVRVVHSFDPCLSCSVHMVRPGKNAEKFFVTA